MNGIHPENAAGAVDLLRGTKEMLLREGYCKGAYVDGGDEGWPVVLVVPGSNPCGTAHCLLGSLRVVAGYHPMYDHYFADTGGDPQYRVALRTLDSLVPADVIEEARVQGYKSAAESYAEDLDTTVEDLVDLIDRAISELAPATAPREAVVA